MAPLNGTPPGLIIFFGVFLMICLIVIVMKGDDE